MRVALVDYGAGNLASVRKALVHLGASVLTPRVPAEVAEADAVIVPGVGHFQATAALDAAWRDAIVQAIGDGRPLLGICLGMQWLFEGSEEAPERAGLGVMSGRCTRLGETAGVHGPGFEDGADRAGEPPALRPAGASRIKVPHVGWNALRLLRPSRLLEGIAEGAQVYFTHSYAAPVGPDCVATTTHGTRFAAAVERGHVGGVQFHPEKSGEVGLRVLRNFLDLAR